MVSTTSRTSLKGPSASEASAGKYACTFCPLSARTLPRPHVRCSTNVPILTKSMYVNCTPILRRLFPVDCEGNQHVAREPTHPWIARSDQDRPAGNNRARGVQCPTLRRDAVDSLVVAH